MPPRVPLPHATALVHGFRVLLMLALTPLCACSFPDVTYTGSGGAGGSVSSGGSGVGSSGSTSFNSSLSGSTDSVPADATCPGTCTLPNASARCSGTTCVIDACDSNYADCNHDRADGCEADLQNDSLDCGSCGTACVAPAQCKKGTCK